MEECDGMAALVDKVRRQEFPHTMNALTWAKEFNMTAQTLGYPAMDESWLMGWFANAVMAGYDTARMHADQSLA